MASNRLSASRMMLIFSNRFSNNYHKAFSQQPADYSHSNSLYFLLLPKLLETGYLA